MRAIVQDRYGTVEDLRVAEVGPPIVGEGEALVRVRAASVHPDVWHMVVGRPYVLRMMGAGFRRPKNPIPGTDMAGVVEAVGSGVTAFRPGDEVFGETVRGYSWSNGGAYAEYVSVPVEGLAHKPAGIGFEHAAAVPTSGLIALRAIKHEAKVEHGDKVLVNGAGGGVGATAVQLAKAAGAAVTGVDSADKLDMIRTLGAEHVIDYRTQDFTEAGVLYDVIVDIPGNHPFSSARRALAPDGTYVLIGHANFGRDGQGTMGSLPQFFGLLVRAPFTKQLANLDFKMLPKGESMAYLKELLENGQLTPVIDGTFPLEKVPEAIRYLESGTAKGKIIITP